MNKVKVFFLKGVVPSILASVLLLLAYPSYAQTRTGLGMWALSRSAEIAKEEADKVTRVGGIKAMEEQAAKFAAQLDENPPCQHCAVDSANVPVLPVIEPCESCQSDFDTLQSQLAEIKTLKQEVANQKTALDAIPNMRDYLAKANLRQNDLAGSAQAMGRRNGQIILAKERLNLAVLKYNLGVSHFEQSLTGYNQCVSAQSKCELPDSQKLAAKERGFYRTYQHYELLKAPMSRLHDMKEPYKVLSGKESLIRAFLNGQSKEATDLLCKECDRLNAAYSASKKQQDRLDEEKLALEKSMEKVRQNIADQEQELSDARIAENEAYKKHGQISRELYAEEDAAWRKRTDATRKVRDIDIEITNRIYLNSNYIRNGYTQKTYNHDGVVVGQRFTKEEHQKLKADLAAAIVEMEQAKAEYKAVHTRVRQTNNVSNQAKAVYDAKRRYQTAQFAITRENKELKRLQEVFSRKMRMIASVAKTTLEREEPTKECNRIQCYAGAAYNPPSEPAKIEVMQVITVSGFNPLDSKQVEQLNPAVSSSSSIVPNPPVEVPALPTTPSTPSTPTTPEPPAATPLVVSFSGSFNFTHTVDVSPCPTAAGSVSISSNNGNPLQVTPLGDAGTIASRLDQIVTGNNTASPALVSEFNCISADNGSFTGNVNAVVRDTVTGETQNITVPATGQVNG